MSRAALPQRRCHEVFEFKHGSLHYVAGIGRASPNDSIREVFLNCGRAGTDAETLARDSAVILSIALQYGVPILVMANAVTRNFDGKPSGPIGALLDMMVSE